MNWLGGNWFGYTMACRRYRLPRDIEGQYLHTRTDSYDKTKVACFFNPVFSIKNTEKVVERMTGDYGEDVEHVTSKAFQYVHVLFNPKSLCNTRTVNTLNYLKTSAILRARGKFYHRRYCGIEMNKVSQLYLVTYSHIDSIDHLITNCHMK